MSQPMEHGQSGWLAQYGLVLAVTPQVVCMYLYALPHAHRCVLLAITLLLALVSLPAHAKRVALLVGNANYQVSRLTNPPNDVARDGGRLASRGFQSANRAERQPEPDEARRARLWQRWRKAQTWLLSTTAATAPRPMAKTTCCPWVQVIEKEADYEVEAVSANALMRQIAGARPKAAIVVLDACRDNPYASVTKSTTKGLGRMDAPTGTMIAFATAPNTTASDEGHYARVLARQTQNPWLELLDVFRNTGSEVKRLSGGKQEPRISEVSINERLYLAGQGIQVASLGVESTGRPMQADPEQDAWELAKRRDTATSYQIYLNRYPSGQYAETARDALAGLQPAPSPALRPAATPQPTAQSLPQASPATQSTGIAQTGQVFKDCAGCPEMVVIPAGSFTMGSNEDENEKPPHPVNIRSFALGKFEVTQGQWKTVMGSNPSEFSDCGDNCPVDSVSWHDVQVFLQLLNQKTGQQYRLPSEAEWEYAARAGSIGRWTFGDDEMLLDQHAWFTSGLSFLGFGRRPHPVGQKLANAFGLHDMHGSVYEWVQDVWHENYIGAPTDGSVWNSGGDSSLRVFRGGSWINFSYVLRSALRSRNTPDFRYEGIGFRIARTVP
jgi:formylglycine-generating enzyme required for sulfatase activity